MEKSKVSKENNCIVLTESTMKKPLKYGWNKYKVNYSYTKEKEKIEVEIYVQALSIFKVFKWVNKEILAKVSDLKGAKVGVLKIKK